MTDKAKTDSVPAIRQFIRRRDGLVALTFLVAIWLEIWIFADLQWSWWQQILATIIAPLLAGSVGSRSTRPFSSYAVNIVATIVMIALGYVSAVYQWANLLMLFSVSAAYTGRESAIALLASFAGVTFFFISFEDQVSGALLNVLSFWFVGWLLGRIHGARYRELQLRSDRDLTAELATTRAARLELEQQRSTMARELHDLIGHTVNVMVVHAGAGKRAVKTDPAGAERAFETIASTGRSALDELDRVLGILRDDVDTPMAPLPGLEALPELIDEFNTAGLDVSISTNGPVDSIPAGLGLSAYRILQEALTNTLKHGRTNRAEVMLSVSSSSVRILVQDGGGGDSAVQNLTPGSTAGGRGLAGISERVQLHGGTATFGPTGDDGYRVECTIPLSPTIEPVT